ncbi:MAG: TonB-dependent receptor plug domain-containing protein, partial [Lysobacterales bacterium]
MRYLTVRDLQAPFLTFMTAVCLAGCLLASSVQAAEDDPAEPDSAQQESDEGDLDVVIVTGSRVRRSNLDSPSPVYVFEATQLQNLGITTLGEFSRYLPQNAEVLSDAGSVISPKIGTAGFNLRGIGLDGTLTLINGRRIAPFGSTGDLEPFVDINSIPVAAIDRIEILTDGASAIYGSEAVAGVVNIITLQRIEGITAEGGYLTTGEGDGDEWDASIAGGWSNPSTSFTGSLSWFDRGLIWSRNRDWSSTVDLTDRGGLDVGSTLSSPPTIRLLPSGPFVADPACPEDSPYARRLVGARGNEFCSFNVAWFTSMQQPSERLGTTATLRHDFPDSISFFTEVMANRSKTSVILAPTPLGGQFPFFVPADHP